MTDGRLERSPSTGWRGVYDGMDVPPDVISDGGLYAYGCPKCDAHNSNPDGYVRAGVVTVACGVCGFVEQFQRGHLAGEGATL